MAFQGLQARAASDVKYRNFDLIRQLVSEATGKSRPEADLSAANGGARDNLSRSWQAWELNVPGEIPDGGSNQLADSGTVPSSSYDLSSSS